MLHEPVTNSSAIFGGISKIQVPDSLSFIIITDSLSFCCANYHPYNPSEIRHNQANIQLKQIFLDME